MSLSDTPLSHRLWTIFRHYARLPFVKWRAFPFEPGEFEGGRLTLDPIPILRLEGAPYEMGRQHGRLVGKQAHALYESYLRTFVELTLGRDQALVAARTMERFLDDAMKAELRGLADGAELRYEDVLLSHTFLDAYKLLFCSVVIAVREATGGEVLLGRNLDFPSLGIAHRASILVLHEPADGNRLATVGFPGLTGALSGMNEHGLSLGVLEAYNQEDSIKGIPYALLYRRALERCATVSELREFLLAHPRTAATNLGTADGTGEGAVFELTHRTLNIRSPSSGLVMATNHFASIEDENLQCPRYQALREYVAAHRGPYTESDIHAMLRRVALPSITLQTMVFRPERRSFVLQIGKPPATARRRVELSGLW